MLPVILSQWITRTSGTSTAPCFYRDKRRGGYIREQRDTPRNGFAPLAYSRSSRNSAFGGVTLACQAVKRNHRED